MNEDLDTLFNFAAKHGISVEAGMHGPDWIPVAIPSRRMVFLNLNWPRPAEIPFQFAHEITHVLRQDIDFAAYTRRATDPCEVAATRGAIRILVKLFGGDDLEQFNLADFVNRFQIPMGYEPLVVDAAFEIIDDDQHPNTVVY